MPRGVALSLQFCILIFSRVQAGFTARQIFELIFVLDASIISYRHLKYLHNRLLNDAEFTRLNTCGPVKKTGGRNAIMSAGFFKS